MNLGKLKRTLLREFQRSPAKTCVLLGLLPLAGYFIGPLVWKQFKPAKATGSTVATVPSGIPTATNSLTPAPTAGPAEVTWKDAATWMALDSRMRAAPSLAKRDPFRPTVSADELAKAANAKAESQAGRETVVNDVRPEDCGLRLTATVVGSRLRMATINGKQYHENAAVAMNTAAESGDSPAIDANNAFVLKVVDRKFVILERNGKSYQLQLAR